MLLLHCWTDFWCYLFSDKQIFDAEQLFGAACLVLNRFSELPDQWCRFNFRRYLFSVEQILGSPTTSIDVFHAFPPSGHFRVYMRRNFGVKSENMILDVPLLTLINILKYGSYHGKDSMYGFDSKIQNVEWRVWTLLGITHKLRMIKENKKTNLLWE